MTLARIDTQRTRESHESASRPADRSVGEVALAPLLHIGYVKTGSTWLQRHLFDNREAGFATVSSRTSNGISYTLVKPNALWYDREAPRAEMQPKIKRAQSEGLVPVITHERLAGSPHCGGYDAVQTSRRLAELVPDARVLIVIREQRAMIRSIYNQYVREGGPCTLRQYLNPPPGAKIPLFDLRFLEYHRLIEHYRTLFLGRVLVLLYEELRQRPLLFYNAIAHFAGTPNLTSVPEDRVNASINGAVLFLRQKTNLVLGRDNLNPAGWRRSRALDRLYEHLDRLLPKRCGHPYESKIDRLIVDKVSDFFVYSNRITSDLVGQDLSRFGYQT